MVVARRTSLLSTGHVFCPWPGRSAARRLPRWEPSRGPVAVGREEQELGSAGRRRLGPRRRGWSRTDAVWRRTGGGQSTPGRCQGCGRPKRVRHLGCSKGPGVQPGHVALGQVGRDAAGPRRLRPGIQRPKGRGSLGTRDGPPPWRTWLPPGTGRLRRRRKKLEGQQLAWPEGDPRPQDPGAGEAVRAACPWPDASPRERGSVSSRGLDVRLLMRVRPGTGAAVTAPLRRAGEVPVSDARFQSERAMSPGLEPGTSSCQPWHRTGP